MLTLKKDILPSLLDKNEVLTYDVRPAVIGSLLLLFCWILILPLGSFLIDPFLLIITGSIIVYVTVRFLYKVSRFRKWILLLSLLTLIIFYIVSISLYLNLGWIEWMWRLLGAESGFEFMINSGVFNYPFVNHNDAPVYVHLLGGFLFTLYPFWLYLGIRLGYILYGKNEYQTGVVGMLW